MVKQPASGSTSIIGVTIGIAVVAGAISQIYGFPGGVVAWFCLNIALWIEPAPAVAARSGVQQSDKKIARTHKFNAVKSGRRHLWGGYFQLWKNGASWSASLIALAGVLIAGLPLRPILMHGKPVIAMLPESVINGVFGLASIAALFLIHLSWTGFTKPTSSIRDNTSWITTKKNELPILVIGVGVAIMAGIATASVLRSIFRLPPFQLSWPGAVLIGFLTGTLLIGAIISLWRRPEIITEWRYTLEARSVWAAIWPTLKLQPEPMLEKRSKIADGVWKDEFNLHFSLPVSTVLANKLILAAFPAERVFPVYVTDQSSGEVSQTKFGIILWSLDSIPALAEQFVDIDLASTWIEVNTIATLRNAGYSTPIMTSCELLTQNESTPQVFNCTFEWSEGLTLEAIMPLIGEISSAIGVDIVIDPIGNSMYVGNIQTANFSDPNIRTIIDGVILINEWERRWSEITKDASPPTANVQSIVDYDLSTVDGRSYQLTSIVFTTRESMEPARYFGMEDKLSTTMGALPMVSITPLVTRGVRHSQRLMVTFSEQRHPFPVNPSMWGKTNDNDVSGIIQAVWWQINRIFRSLKLSLPDLYDFKFMNSSQTTRIPNLVRISLKLYGKDTAVDVIGAAEKIRQAFGCEWLRPKITSDGIDLYVGPNRSVVERYHDAKMLDLVDELDWEEAWRVAHVTGDKLAVPVLHTSSHLPNNHDVVEYFFEIPKGFNLAKLRGQMDTLRTSTGLVYIDIDEVPESPNIVRVLASHKSPLPELAPMDVAQIIDKAPNLPIGVKIDGDLAVVSNSDTPHILVSGASGAGKAQPLDEEIPVPISERFPIGKARIGDLEVGDEVYGIHGLPVRIDGLSSITDEFVCTVELENGTIIRCSTGHLWRVKRRRPNVSTNGLDDNGESIYASGVRHILTVVMQDPTGDIAKRYFQEINTLSRSAISDEAIIDAVLTTAELECLLSNGEQVWISTVPIYGEITDFVGSSIGEICDMIASPDWMNKDSLSAVTHLPDDTRVSILRELINRLPSETHDDWTVIKYLDQDNFIINSIADIAASLGWQYIKKEFSLLIKLGVTTEKTLITSVNVTEDRVPMRCLSIADQDHCYLARGFTPTHNSVIVRNLVVGAILRGDWVYVLDPVKLGVDLKAVEPYVRGFPKETTRLEAVGYLTAIQREVNRRLSINTKYGAENGFSELIPPDERYPMITIQIDEFTSLLVPHKSVAGMGGSDLTSIDQSVQDGLESQAASAAATLVGWLLRTARSANVCVILATQRLDQETINSIPGATTDFRTNLGRILMGNASQADRKVALKRPDETPKVPSDGVKGRGVYESGTGEGVVFQAWYSTSLEIGEMLAQQLSPLAESDKINPMSFLPDSMKAQFELRDTEAVVPFIDEDAIEEISEDELFGFISVEDAEVESDETPVPEEVPINVQLDVDTTEVETADSTDDMDDPRNPWVLLAARHRQRKRNRGRLTIAALGDLEDLQTEADSDDGV